jgi:predicted transcriptional regulator
MTFNKIVLLGIKPKYAEDILSGSKKWEYRRRPPLVEEPTPMALYASEKAKAIVGMCLVTKILREPLESLIKLTISETTSTEEGLKEYFKGLSLCSALRVEKPLRFEMKLNEIRKTTPGFFAPQNFYYLKRDGTYKQLFEALEKHAYNIL